MLLFRRPNLGLDWFYLHLSLIRRILGTGPDPRDIILGVASAEVKSHRRISWLRERERVTGPVTDWPRPGRPRVTTAGELVARIQEEWDIVVSFYQYM